MVEADLLRGTYVDPRSVAKFPHRDDDWDVMGWECVALDLAGKAGIATPQNATSSRCPTHTGPCCFGALTAPNAATACPTSAR